MEERTLMTLMGLAAAVGFVHTVAGPDHYLPFVAMARAGRWSLRKALTITLLCGVGHVLGSVALGSLGIALGWSIGGLNRVEGIRGSVAGWLLFVFGLVYFVWGLRQVGRGHRHRHFHVHADGTTHEHEHDHRFEHAHVHGPTDATRPASMVPWALFTIFVFGPCEPLIPLLMYPAAVRNPLGVVAVTVVFSAVTLLTMTAAVAAGYFGFARFVPPRFNRFGHAGAGLVMAACALAIQFGL